MEKLVTADNNKVPPTFVSQTLRFYVEFLMTTNLFCNESNEWLHISFPLCSSFQYSRLCRPEEGRHNTVEVTRVKCDEMW